MHSSEEDPKKPRPVGRSPKGENALESQEHGFRNVPGGKDDNRDRHRHVISC
jgi:hypothetical protein